MRFSVPLERGILIRRYKRFLADVRLDDDDRLVTAHCANSGSMLSVDQSGSEVWLSPADNQARKLPYTWELIRVGSELVGINTFRPNALVAEAIADGSIDELRGYTVVRREVPYGKNSRIDLLLQGGDGSPCFVEVKNVTLRRGVGADAPVEFPDAVTARGTKHLAELAHAKSQGARAVLLFLAQRSDASQMAIAGDIDGTYARALSEAAAAGVEFLSYRCSVTAHGISVTDRVALALP